MGQATRPASKTEAGSAPLDGPTRLRRRTLARLGDQSDRVRDVVKDVLPRSGPARRHLLEAWVARETAVLPEFPGHREELRRIAQRMSWRLVAMERLRDHSAQARQRVQREEPSDPVEPLLRARRVALLEECSALSKLDHLGPESFDRLAPWVEDFEACVWPTTLHFLFQSERDTRERMVQFLLCRALDADELREVLLAGLGGGDSASAMLDTLGPGYLRTRPAAVLVRMLPHYRQWSGVVRYYQDPDFRDRCPPELAAAADAAYLELLRRVGRSWRTELRSVDVEDAVQETITRLVSEGLRTYRYESNLLNYLCEVAVDYLRRQYHRPKACELSGDEPIVDPRPGGPEWARARDGLLALRAAVPDVIRKKFKSSNWSVAERIWEEVLREANRELEGDTGTAAPSEPQQPITDETLAEEIARTTGRRVSVPNLRVIRSRLRTAMGEALGLRPAEQNE